jgi:hypothetical protein
MESLYEISKEVLRSYGHRGMRGSVELATRLELGEDKHLRDIVENYDIPSSITSPHDYHMASKAHNKMGEFMNHAQNYHQHKASAEHHHGLAAHHEEEERDGFLAKAHHHQSQAHEAFAKHFADKLVKDHGLSHKAIEEVHCKHKNNPSYFTVALAGSQKK